MIKIKNTPNLTGVQITGTFEDIYELYESIGRLIGSGVDLDEDDLVKLRIQGVCYDLRHCYMGDREVEFVENNYGEELILYHEHIHPNTNVEYSVKILWLEVMFVALALDDYIHKYEDDKSYKKLFKDSGLPEEAIEEFNLNRYKDIALGKFFQEMVWLALGDVCGNNAYKRLRKASKAGEGYYYNPMKYTGYITHYLDTLEMKYMKASREKRTKLLATLIGKIIHQDDEYDDIADAVRQYSRNQGVPYGAIELSNVEWPEDIEW